MAAALRSRSFLPSGSPRAAEVARPVAVGVRLVPGRETGASLMFDLSRPVDGARLRPGAPDRIVVDLPEVDFQLDPPRSVRGGTERPRWSRLSLRPACARAIADRHRPDPAGLPERRRSPSRSLRALRSVPADNRAQALRRRRFRGRLQTHRTLPRPATSPAPLRQRSR